MEKPATSFKPLTISSPSSMSSTAEPTSKLTRFAATRARLLFGSYRKGEANDPETYIAAITSTLANYPEDIIKDVTHPSGLPTVTDFLPSVKEVFVACEVRMAPRREFDRRRARVEAQIRERIEWEKGGKP